MSRIIRFVNSMISNPIPVYVTGGILLSLVRANSVDGAYEANF